MCDTFESFVWEATPCGDLALLLDREALLRCATNYVSNAIKFTLEEGVVMASTRLDESGDVVLTVTDTGIGMT